MKTRWLILFVVALLLVGCSSSEQTVDEQGLSFSAFLMEEQDCALEITLEIQNPGPSDFEGDEDFQGVMDLETVQGDLRARANFFQLGPIPADGKAQPMVWQGDLEAGDYHLVWGSPKYGYTEVSFEMVPRDGQVCLGSEIHKQDQVGEPAAFPIPEGYGELADMIDQARGDLSERTGIPVEEILVQRIEERVFSDTSLDVPEPGQMYAEVLTPGYVITLLAQGQAYPYHTDGERVVYAP